MVDLRTIRRRVERVEGEGGGAAERKVRNMFANLIRFPSALPLVCCAVVVVLFTSSIQAQTPLGHGYIRNGEHIHFEGGGATGLNGETRIDAPSQRVRHLASGYFADKNGVYWGVDPLRVADPAKVRLILHDPYGYQIFSDRNGVFVNGLKFLHAQPGDFVVRDNLSAVGGHFLFVVDTYHITPITVFREDGGLIVETVMYDPQSSRAMCVVRGDLTDRGMVRVTVSPMPEAEPSVPEWQLQVFQRPDLAKLLREKAELYLP